MVFETASLTDYLLLLILFKVINREDAFSVSIVESKQQINDTVSMVRKTSDISHHI